VVDDVIELNPSNVESLVEFKLLMVEGSFDVKPNTVYSSVDVKSFY